MTALTSSNSVSYVIPLVPQNQEFYVSLNGTTYHLKVKWNSFQQSWSLYIEDDQQNPILSGVPLVTGCDLLEQFAYLGLGGAMVVQSSNNPDEVPDYTSLGSTGNLFFVVPVAPVFIA